jgi:transcriptional regulator with XRE-family HTH domain
MNKLKSIRKKYGISQNELARRLGTTQGQVCRLEKSTRQLTQNWIERIARVLGCTQAELLGEDAPEPLTNREKALLEIFRNLPEREQDGLLAAFNALAQPAPDRDAANE